MTLFYLEVGGRDQGLRRRHRREHLRDELVDALPHHARHGGRRHRPLLLLQVRGGVIPALDPESDLQRFEHFRIQKRIH